MAAEDREYVITSLEYEGCETEIITVELPSREIVAQLEVPHDFLKRITALGETYGISTEQALGERLELNRARVALQSAKSVDEIDQVRTHLVEAKEYLAGVEGLETEIIEAEIRQVWADQLDSSA